MENPVLTLTFHLDTMEMDVDAPTLSIEFAISMLDRAKRLLEAKEKVETMLAVSELRATHTARIKLP